MSWIFLATAGQFLNAIVAILDKYIVTDEKALPKPFVYAFYSCLVTGGWMAVYAINFIPGLAYLPLPQISNVESPSIQVVGMSFLAAYTFFLALVSLYKALKRADASDVMPVIGAISAISAFGMSYLFLDITLSVNYIYGILLLASGTFLVSHMRFSRDVALYAIHSGVFFALHYIAMKGLFLETSFDDGFFWSRVAFIVFALTLLLIPSYLVKITEQTKVTSKRTGILVLGTKILAGVAAFMLLKATDLGEVAVVQALDGLKFVFIILISLVIGQFIPTAAGENEFDFKTVMRKVVYVMIISIGFIMLFT